jgi:hypothetical protein
MSDTETELTMQGFLREVIKIHASLNKKNKTIEEKKQILFVMKIIKTYDNLKQSPELTLGDVFKREEIQQLSNNNSPDNNSPNSSNCSNNSSNNSSLENSPVHCLLSESESDNENLFDNDEVEKMRSIAINLYQLNMQNKFLVYDENFGEDYIIDIPDHVATTQKITKELEEKNKLIQQKLNDIKKQEKYCEIPSVSINKDYNHQILCNNLQPIENKIINIDNVLNDYNYQIECNNLQPLENKINNDYNNKLECNNLQPPQQNTMFQLNQINQQNCCIPYIEVHNLQADTNNIELPNLQSDTNNMNFDSINSIINGYTGNNFNSQGI